MTVRHAVMLATTMLLPALGLAQPVTRPPLPPVAAPTAPAGQAAAPGLMQAPGGLPNVAMQPVTYGEWLRNYYHVFAIPKKNAILLGGNRVKPSPILDMVMEIVGETKDEYMVRNLPPEDPQSVGFVTWVRSQRDEIREKAKIEYLKDKWLIVDQPDVPPPFTNKVQFVERDKGLPKGGRWQISFDIADMNGDGLPDLVFGPPRTSQKLVPHIFAQLQDGSWAEAPAVWPTEGIKLDYGSVRVADFDGDGNKDIAIACHLGKTYVLYGDGKGNFTRFVTLPQTNPAMTARALTVADFNNDGRPDIASYAELDLNMANSQRITSGLVNIALNLPSGWKAVGEKSFPAYLMGDHLVAADLFMDGHQDLALTSHSANVMDLIFHNLGGGDTWEPVATQQQPVYAYVLANAVGRLDRFKQPDVLECFQQLNPWRHDTPTQACAIYRFHDAEGRPTLTPSRTVLFQEKSTDTYNAAAVGDIDGDGRDDIAIVSSGGRVRVFLQGDDGAFYEQAHAGMDQPGTDLFDVRIADLYHDGKGEVIFAGSPVDEKGGGVWVYQPVPAGKAPAKSGRHAS